MVSAYPASAAIFEQHNLPSKEQFTIFAKGLVGVIGSWTSLDRPDCHLQYKIASEGSGFHGDKLRALPDPIPAKKEIIPDPDSIPLSVLNYPTENTHEIDFAAYDSPALTVSSSVDGPDAM